MTIPGSHDWQSLAREAESLCRFWHTATDRNGRPAYEHPLEVARRVFQETGSWAAYCAACLHDTLEDTDMPHETLQRFPRIVAVTVLALTRGKEEPANAYFRRVLQVMLAQQIKVHDIEHNFSPGRADEKILAKADLYAGWHGTLCNGLRIDRSFCMLHPGLESVCACPRHTKGRRLRAGGRDRGIHRVAGARVANSPV